MTASLTSSASIPEKHYPSAPLELAPPLSAQPFCLEDLKRQLTPTLDPHPFSDEFYLHEFAAETATESPHRHLRLNPMLTSAASGLSKKVASLRRALARMMP
jgi:hypothetical protein